MTSRQQGSARLQLDPGIPFRCSCRQHSLTPAAVYRIQFCGAIQVCKLCNGQLFPVGDLPQMVQGEFYPDSFLCCELEDGNHVLTMETSEAVECNFPPPRIVLSEEQRRAVVRALYRPGDLEFFAKEDKAIRDRALDLMANPPPNTTPRG